MIRLFILLGRLNRIEGWVLIPVEWLNYIRVYPTCQTKESELHCCCQDAWKLLTGRASSQVALPSVVSSRVGGSIADCGGELTGPVATNNLYYFHNWVKYECD
jgi:hypothetical protein